MTPFSRRLLRFLAIATFMLAPLAARPAQAQGQFLGGSIIWVRDVAYNDGANYRFLVSFEGSFRRSYPWSPSNPTVGNGPIYGEVFSVTGVGYNPGSFNIGLMVDSVNAAEDWFHANYSTYILAPYSASPLTVTWTGCCRVPTLLEGNNDTSYRIQTVIDPSKGTKSPTTAVLPRVYARVGQPTLFTVPNTAYDGFTNTVSIQPTSASLLATAQPSTPAGPGAFSVSATGLISWTPPTPGLHQIQLLITSKDSNDVITNSTPVEFTMSVLAPCPTCPAVTLSRGDGSTEPLRSVDVYYGVPVRIQYRATMTNGLTDFRLSMATTPRPPGSVLSAEPLEPTPYPTATYQFDWTPQPGDPFLEGESVVCYQGTAQDFGSGAGRPLPNVNSFGALCDRFRLAASPLIHTAGVLRDFSAAAPAFARPNNEYNNPPFPAYVAATLGPGRKPTYIAGSTPNIGAAAFNSWWNGGTGQTAVGTLLLTFSNGLQSDPGLFNFSASPFWPRTEPPYGLSTEISRQKNFTYELHGRANYSPGQVLTYKSTDELHIFVNGKYITPTLQGTHTAEKTWVLNLDSQAVGLGLVAGQPMAMDFFYATRGLSTTPAIQLQVPAGFVSYVPGVDGTPLVWKEYATQTQNAFVTLNATVEEDGRSPVLERGFLYIKQATNADPKLGDSGVIVQPVSGTLGAMSYPVVDLSGAGRWTWKAYARNATGTAYTLPRTIDVSCPAIAVTPGYAATATPVGQTGMTYTHAFVASTPPDTHLPFTWSISQGGQPWISVASASSTSGNVTGIPTDPGAFPYRVTATDARGCSGSYDFTLNVGTGVHLGDVAIREFRTRGPLSTQEEYFVLENRTDHPIEFYSRATNGSPSRPYFTLALGAINVQIPNGTRVAARGSLLVANSAFTTIGATPDITYSGDVPDVTNFSLFDCVLTGCPTDPRTVLDGFKIGGFGAAFLPTVTQAGEFAWVRKNLSGLSQFTPNILVPTESDPKADFLLVSPTAAAFTATGSAPPVTTLQSMLGAPSPSNRATRDVMSDLQIDYVEPNVGVNSNPNRLRIPTPVDRLEFRRRITNTSGAPVSGLRLRFVEVTTWQSPGYTSGIAQADLRPISSGNVTLLSVTSTGVAGGVGLTLVNTPDQSTYGGGWNSILTIPGGPLAPGASIDINVALRVGRVGNYKFITSVEGQ